MRIGVMGGEAKDLVNFRGHLMSEMAKAGHKVYGIAPRGTTEMRDALEKSGVTYVPIEIDRTGLNPFGDLVSVFRIWKTLRQLRLDVLLTYEVKAVVFGTLAAALAGVPRRFAMITGRGTTLQGKPQGFTERAVNAIVKLMYRTTLRRTKGVLFQNMDDLNFFAEEGMLPGCVARKIINGSGVDLNYFASCPLPEGQVTFVLVGRLLRNKGIHEYVEACRLLASRNVSARFQLLGPLDDNPNGIKIEQIKAWASEGVVEYLGEAKDVRPVLASAHVLVLPSYGEGTPRSVLEAMSMGRAIVTTDSPGCRETVEDGKNGYLVPVGDSIALADAMSKLVSDTSLITRFGAECRHLAETKYDVRLVTAEIQTFMGTV